MKKRFQTVVSIFRCQITFSFLSTFVYNDSNWSCVHFQQCNCLLFRINHRCQMTFTVHQNITNSDCLCLLLTFTCTFNYITWVHLFLHYLSYLSTRNFWYFKTLTQVTFQSVTLTFTKVIFWRGTYTFTWVWFSSTLYNTGKTRRSWVRANLFWSW